MAVLFVMQVNAESCNDDFIKEMIVNICGMGGIKLHSLTTAALARRRDNNLRVF